MNLELDLNRPQDPADARFRLAEAARRVIAELTSSSATSEAGRAASAWVYRPS